VLLATRSTFVGRSECRLPSSWNLSQPAMNDDQWCCGTDVEGEIRWSISYAVAEHQPRAGQR
jgi:hypothetical protein